MPRLTSMPALCAIAMAAAICGPTLAANGLRPSEPTMHGRASVSLNAQTVDLTLIDAVFLGLRRNRTIRSAYVDRVAQKFDLRVAQDYFSPHLNINGSYIAQSNQDDRVRTTQFGPAATLISTLGTQVSLGWLTQKNDADQGGLFRNDGVALTVVQPLVRGAGREVVTAPLRLAKLTEQSNKLGLQSTVSSTVSQIIYAYRAVLQAKEQLDISTDALARARQLMEVNKALIAAGRMAQVDIIQTEADIANQQLSEESARNQLAVTRLALLQLIGVDLRTQFKAVDPLDPKPVAITLLDAQRIAMAHQPAYLQQLIALQQATINLTVAHNNRLWDISLVGGAGQSRDRFRGEFGDSSNKNWQGYAGVQLSIPIDDMTAQQGEVHAKADVETQTLQAKETEEQLKRDITNAVMDMNSRWRQYQIASRSVELSRKKLQAEREKLQAGRSSNFQVLSFETDLRNAQSARLGAVIGYLNSQTQLDEQVGMTLKSWDIELND